MHYNLNLRSIKKKGWIWEIHPFLFKHSAHTIYPHIYVPEWMYETLRSKNPDPIAVASLLHEQVHIKRQKEIGLFKYGLLYLFSRKFRLEEELFAIKPQMDYLKKNGIEFDIKKRAQYLSGVTYLWCTSYSNALKRLQEIE